MSEYYRTFEAGPDPFGATWKAEFRWAQNGISIRHADTIDVKFEITCGEIHEEKIMLCRTRCCLRRATPPSNR